MPKMNRKFGKSPSCWNLEHACPRPERDFCLTAPPRIQSQPSNAAEMEAVECGGEAGGSALASHLVENEHIGLRNYKIQNGSAVPQRHRPSLETLCK